MFLLHTWPISAVIIKRNPFKLKPSNIRRSRKKIDTNTFDIIIDDRSNDSFCKY